MAKSAVNEAVREARRALDERRSFDERSIRAAEACEQGTRDFAQSHGLTFGEARRRLKATAHRGRTTVVDADE